MSEKRIGPVQGQGSSMAGEETAEILPEMNLAFDVGRAPRELISIDYVFLTHGHMDHSAGLAYYFSQRNFVGNKPGAVLDLGGEVAAGAEHPRDPGAHA